MSGFMSGLAGGLEQSGVYGAAADKLGSAMKPTPTDTPPGPSSDVLQPVAAPDVSGIPTVVPNFGPDDGSHPMADADHPFWGVMNAVAGGQAAPNAMPQGMAPTAGMQRGGVVPQPVKPEAIVGIPAYEDGGYVHSKEMVNGVPSYKVGTPGVGGAIKDLVDHLTHGGVEGAQRTAAGETAQRVDSNETGKAIPDGYADGGFVTPPTPNVQMTGRAAGIASGLSQGMAIGEDLKNAWLQKRQREAAEAEMTAVGGGDTDPNAPGFADKVQDAVMHPIQAVRGAVNDVADWLKGTSHDAGKGAIAVPEAATSSAGATPPSPIPSGGPTTAITSVPEAKPSQPVLAPAGGAPGSQPAPAAAGAAAPPAGGGAAAGGPSPQGNMTANAPTPTTPEAAASDSVVKGAAAQAGVPTNLQQAAAQAKATPDQVPHSLTPDWYEGLQQRAIHVGVLAARAGMDPKQAYDSTMAMAVTHMQGQVMRQYGAAYNALQANDMKGVETALRNANYYLPDGKDLHFEHAADGSIQVRNPFIGMPGHENDPTMIPINASSISLMATAALHPENFHTEIAGMVKAATEAKKDAMEAQGHLLAGQGSAARGAAAITRANAYAQTVPATIYKDIGQGDKAERGTNASGQPKISLTAMRAAQIGASKAVQDNALGQYTVVPTQVPAKDRNGQPLKNPDGTPMMQPNLDPNAGKQVRDPTKIPTDFKGLPPDAVNVIQRKAAAIASANAASTVGGAGVSDQEAATIAAKIYHYENGWELNPQTGQMIKSGPETGRHVKPGTGTGAGNPKVLERNVVKGVGKDAGILHVWMGDHWANIYTNTNVDTRSPGVDTSGGGGGGNPADNEPATDPADAAYDQQTDVGE